MNKTESKEVVNQISYVRLAFRCRSFLWLVLTWIMIQCHLSTQIFVVIFIYLCVVCYIFFLVPFFSKERCLIDNDLAINFMFVSLAVHFGLCFFCLITFSQAIGDLIRFITLHLQPILPIYIPFFIHFLSFSCFINIRQIGSVFFSSRINFICCGYGHKLSPYFKSWATFWLSLQHWDCHCCCRFVQST